jgi:shikimate kinase
MGSGKSTVGARIASMLERRFVDADAEIQAAANMSVSEIFEAYGEGEFRALERRVIARLLREGPMVLATGGGAFMDPATRALMKERAISVWLRADLDVLMKRVGKRGGRPLLEADDPRAVMAELIRTRYPVYAEADLVVESEDGPHEVTVERVMKALADYSFERGELT